MKRSVHLTHIYCNILRMSSEILYFPFSIGIISRGIPRYGQAEIVYKDLERTFKNLIEYDGFLWEKHFKNSLTFADIKNSECVVGFHLYKNFKINLFTINFDEMLITSRILTHNNCVKYIQDSKRLKLNKKLKKVTFS